MRSVAGVDRGEGKREGREGLQADSLVFWQVWPVVEKAMLTQAGS